MKQVLKIEKKVRVRFNEVDSMGIVWHGSYVAYFEDAREEFGRAYGLDYLSIVAQGYYVPLVNIDFSFKNPLTYGDSAIVEIGYIPCIAAKILFSYRIWLAEKRKVIATGSSVQIFLNSSRELVLYPPEFYVRWQKQNNVYISESEHDL